MIRFLVKKRIPDYTNVNNPEVRKNYGVLGGSLGILCNSLLFFVKLFVGIASHSIAVVSDAFNNLSDMGASVVSVLGARFSRRRPDADHPYGHGRAEYIAALIVAFLIIFVGIELFRSSIHAIWHPAEVDVRPVTMILLMVSVLLKLWMWRYNRYLGCAIGSEMLLAAAKDSLNDVVASGAVIVSAVLAPVCDFPIDGIMGIVVSCLILWAGYGVAKDTIDRLLGGRPEELCRKIEETVLEHGMILGVHGLMIHDYGPGTMIASAHAEVPETLSLVECHDVIDEIEKKILSQWNVDIVIHMDPVATAPKEEC